MYKPRKLYSWIALLSLGLVLVLIIAAFATERYWVQRLNQQVSMEAINVGQYFNSQLERYEHIPDLLTSHYRIRQALQQDTAALALSKVLSDIQKTSGASDVYVLNATGDVIASSNYDSNDSYIGSNYAFRPYFYRAMQGKRWVDYALGLRSGERGIFFSAPIYSEEEIIGAIAVKVDIDKFEQDTEWLAGETSTKFMVFGRDEVVFISNHPYWRLKQLRESEDYSWQDIQATYRYLDLKQQRIPNSQESTAYLDGNIWLLEHSPNTQSRYIFGETQLDLLDFTLVVLRPISQTHQKVQVALILATLSYFTVIGVGIFVFRRLAGYRQLIYTRNSLEKEVTQRTHQLEQAHHALVQSTKLATIGQLSASINHEINQPLSAMSTYLVSTKRMLSKGMVEPACENIAKLESLITRVHRIVSQLKQFSRASEHQLGWCSLLTCINNALIVVGPKINNQNVTADIEPVSYEVWGETLKFEQVLVNLFSNAVEAMAESDEKCITLRAQENGEWVDITLSDTGTGIDLQTIESIFEPFFTTKSDIGLGLGLAISKNIIQSFGGDLTAQNNADHQGATFTLRLKRKTDAND